MKETWRWYGPEDGVSLSDVRQTGASGIVTALYDIAPGAIWRAHDIAARKKQIEAAGLSREVVEACRSAKQSSLWIWATT